MPTEPKTPPRFRSREEYDRWKASQRLGGGRAVRSADGDASATPVLVSSDFGGPLGPWKWVIRTDTEHTIVAQFGMLGRECITLDEVVVVDKKSFGRKSEHTFPLGQGHTARVTVAVGLDTVTCRLFVNGHDMSPSDRSARQGVDSWAALPMVTTVLGATFAQLIVTDGKMSTGSEGLIAYGVGAAVGGSLGGFIYALIRKAREK